MTIREAVELVLQSAALAAGETSGEVPLGNICVLDMGEPVKIIDLARQMIRLTGLRPDKDVAIEITGRRPGEKIFEEIFHSGESLVASGCAGILLAAPRPADANAIEHGVANLRSACACLDRAGALIVLRDLIPEFTGVIDDGLTTATD